MGRTSKTTTGMGYALVLAILAIDSILVASSLRTIAVSNEWVDHSRQVIAELERTLSSFKDAETGQRGYLLSGRDDYLVPFREAERELLQELEALRSLVSDNPTQRTRVEELARAAVEKLNELRQTIALRHEQGLNAALEVVLTNRGQDVMAKARTIGAALRGTENQLLAARLASSRAAIRRAVATFTVTTALALFLLGAVGYLQRREAVSREIAADELSKSEARLSTTLTSIGDAVIATDAGGRVRFLNPMAVRLTEWPQDLAVGRPMEEVFNIVNETTREAPENPVQKVLRDGVVVGLANHTILIGRNGRETPIDDSAAPIRDRNGAITGVVLVFRDVTERKQQEQVTAERARMAEFGRDMSFALNESTTLSQMLARCAEVTVRLLDGAFARIWTMDRTGMVLELQASAGLYNHIDGPHARIPVGQFKIGRIAQEQKPHLTNAVIGDPQFSAQEWASRQGITAFAGYPLVVDDRTVGVWALFSRHAISETAIQAMESVANAIALGIERKRNAEALVASEAWLSTTLASIGDAVIATDAEGNVRFMNPIAESLTGWSHAEAERRPITEVFRIVNEYTREPAPHPVEQVIREGASVGLANHTLLIARTGVETPIEDSAAPIRDPRGAVSGVVMVFRDVTEARAERRLRDESEARKAAILETALDAIITIDRETQVVEWNRAAEQIFGYTRAEAMARPVYELIIPSAKREEHRLGIEHHLSTGERKILDQRIETTAIRSDGSEFPVELSVTRISKQGAPLFTAHVRDITERKRVELERLRLIAIIENSPDFIGLADAQQRVVFVNRAGRALVGLQGEADLNGRQLLEYFVEEEREDIERSVLPVLLEQGHWTGELRFRNFQTGGSTPVLSNAFTIPDPATGRPGFLACVSRDITERKEAERNLRESERQFRTLANSIPQLAWMAGPDGSIFWYNERWYEYTGTQPEQMIGWGWQSVHDANDLPRVLDRFRSAIATGAPWEDTFRLRRHDGEMRWHLSRALPVRNDQGHVARWFGTNTDVTDQKQVAEELRRSAEDLAVAKAEAEDANKAKDQFLAVLSHELRTPLNPILLVVTSMLERPEPPEEVRPNLEMIRQYVNLQARLIDDLLDVMRIVRGKMPLHWEVADAHSLIGQAIQICRSEVFGKELHLDLALEAEHHHINADPARLQQVFWNLIKNAVKFTPEGGRISIRTHNENDAFDPHERVVIEVSDDGIGIEAGVLERIFDPFQQGETSITRRFGGMGLGLAISKGIIEGHGGLLTAESAGSGMGSRFRVELRTLPEMAVGEDSRETPIDPTEVPPPPASRRILLVEDEKATLRLMAKLLRGLGHQVTSAGTIAEAIAAERSGDFELIISDIGLPDGSGLELMRQVKTRRGPIPAIALTGYGMEEDIQRSRQAGFTAHMTKPIDFAKLEAMIRQISPDSFP